MAKTFITLTPSAAAHIKKIMAKKEAVLGFRLSIKTTGCSGYMYVPSMVTQPDAEDIKVDAAQGVTIYIDHRYADIFKGTTIDYKQKGLGQAMLSFDNPNVDSECGCGESFSLKEK